MSTTKKSVVRKTVADTAKIFWNKGKENPFREGCGAFQRTELVRKANGKTRETIELLRGVRGTTVPNLARLGLVRVAA